MDTLFENKHTRDKQWAKDFYGYVFFFRPIMMVINILFGIGFVVNIVSIVVNKKYLIEDGVIYISPSVIILFIYFLILIIRYNRCVNLQMKRCSEMYGKPIDVVIGVDNEKITTKLSIGSEAEMLFVNVKKVINTKKYIYLQTKTQLILCFKKDSFTVGNCDEFVEFLRSKGFKVR